MNIRIAEGKSLNLYYNISCSRVGNTEPLYYLVKLG